MNNCPALAWMKDAEGRYVYINRTFEEVQAMTPSDCLGKTDFDLWPTEVAEQLRKNDLEVLAKGHPVESQEQVPTLERGVKNLLVLKFPVVRDRGIRFIGGFAVDVTHRKELEEQLRKTEQLAELGTLASGMAHEIGTPMNVILGRAEFLMRKTADDSTRKGLETIVTQVERITKIMNQLLSFARKRPLQRRPIDLSVTIKDILDVVQELLKKNKIQMEIDFDNNKRKVFADPDKMSQVLLNLVFNAVHAMSNGGTLRIGLQDSGNQIQLTVADTGCGIPQSYLSKVFDPFFTTKDIGEGTGLGLTVVHGIIQEHKGSISVKSEPEKGTKFVISLPIHESGV